MSSKDLKLELKLMPPSMTILLMKTKKMPNGVSLKILLTLIDSSQDPETEKKNRHPMSDKSIITNLNKKKTPNFLRYFEYLYCIGRVNISKNR